MKVIFRLLTVIILVCVIIFCTGNVLPDISDSFNSKIEDQRIDRVIETSAENDSIFSHEAFNRLYAINSDLIGYLHFDSGIINEPIVKGSSNEVYLRMSFEHTYSSQGTVFMDSDASLDSQHFTIYGHNVYYDDNAKFSPLSRLADQNFYEQNKTFVIFTSDEQIRYEITNVMYLSDDEFLDYDYTKSDFDSKESFNSWIGFANAKNLIIPEKNIVFQDHFITLQTCKRWDEHTIILVLAKEIEFTQY